MLTYLLAGFCFGVPSGVGLAYLMTHPEFRSALFARIHTTATELHDAIAEKLKKD